MKGASHNPVRSARGRAARWSLWLLMAGVAGLFLLPLVWMVSTSLKPEDQAASAELRLLPTPVSRTPEYAAANYRDVWTDRTVQFPLYLRNSLIVAVLGVVGMTLSSAVVAYGLARVRWRGRGAVFAVTLATMMIPFPVLMAPLYLVFREMGLIGTLTPLWLPAWFGNAFNIFLLRQFYMGIPRELDEAATIDGLGHWGIFWRIIVPLSRPALAVVALFHFIYVWNDFLGPLIFITDRDQFTLALGLQLYQGQAGGTRWSLLMAASTLVVLPVVVLFILTQRTFVRGISSDGLKG